jgi:hypothetical protein
MPARLWSAFLARDERGLIGARNDRPDKKRTNDVRQRPAQVAVAARSRTSWPGGSPQRLDVAPNDLALVARRAVAVCVPLLAGARSFAICPIQILSASTATAARQATSTTSATASYSSQRKLFANITFFRRRVCVKLPEKEARSPYI